jgi:hypothetical protein
MTEDKLANARAQGQAQYESIRKLVRALEEATTADARDAAESAIHEDALSVEVRSDWHAPGCGTRRADEYRILLCTGGPACQLTGDLNEYGEPSTAQLQVQDWLTPWTDIHNAVGPAAIMLIYARQFYFSA